MANVFFQKLLGPAQVPDEESAARRLALAQAMQQKALQGTAPQQQGAVAPSYGLGHGLVDLANALVSGYNTRQAEQGVHDAKYSEDRRAKLSNEAMATAMMGNDPTVLGDVPGATSAGLPEGFQDAGNELQSQYVSELTGKPISIGAKALLDAVSGMNPRESNKALASAQLANLIPNPEKEADRELRKLQIDLAVEQKKSDAAAKVEADRLRAEQKREYDELQATLRREGFANDRYRTDSTNAARLEVERVKAEERKKAAIEKIQSMEQSASVGVNDLEGQLSMMRTLYDELDSGAGIVDSSKGGADNLGRSIKSSSVGQFVGHTFGTENQATRDAIEMMRPGLMLAIKQANPGLSSRSLDSNAELKLWLQAATDPKKDISANRRALADIERKYLRKQSIGAAASPAGDVITIASDADYEKLPSDTEFVGPDGKKRRKP